MVVHVHDDAVVEYYGVSSTTFVVVNVGGSQLRYS